MFEKLCMLIADQFGVERNNITMDTSFVDDLGADSIDQVELAMAMEEEFGIEELGEEDISTISTVGDLYQYMQDHLEL